jgi:hypothetical protein
VPLVRIVDPDLTMRMTEYVVLHVLMQQPRILVLFENQRGFGRSGPRSGVVVAIPRSF